MKYAAFASLLLACHPVWPADKLTEEDRIEIIRGLTAEYATAKVALPRSKKPLRFESSGTYDKAVWADAGKELGPAARVGDLIQVTKVTIENERIVLEINNGVKGRKKWYERVEVGMGGSTRPIGVDQNSSAPSGTYIALTFEGGVPIVKATEIKKMLASVLDFEKHSATEQYVETLPEPVKQAIAAKRAIEGMDRDQVLLAMGRPIRKTRETKDGLDLEDWIYGEAPGRITFVTFGGAKVIKVKESYAGLGGSTAERSTPLP